MGPVAAFRQSRGDLVPFADVGRARWRGEDAARDTLGPGWREFAGRLGSLVDGSGAVRQEMAGIATERGRDWNWVSQGQCWGRCKVRRRALRVSRPGQREEAPTEGLGGHQLLVQTDARCPAGQVMGHHLHRQPGGVGGETARREMVQARHRI